MRSILHGRLNKLEAASAPPLVRNVRREVCRQGEEERTVAALKAEGFDREGGLLILRVLTRPAPIGA